MITQAEVSSLYCTNRTFQTLPNDRQHEVLLINKKVSQRHFARWLIYYFYIYYYLKLEDLSVHFFFYNMKKNLYFVFLPKDYI